MGLALAILIASGALSYRSALRGEYVTQWVTHTYIVIETLGAIQSNLVDAETGERGFTLVGETPFLEPYNDAVAQAYRNVDRIRELTADNTAQQHALDRLEPLINAKLAYLRERIDARVQRGPETPARLARTDIGRYDMEQIKGLVAEMKRTEEELLGVRVQELRDSDTRTKLVIVAGNILAILLLSFAGLVTFQEMARRRFAEDEVRKLTADREERAVLRITEIAERAEGLKRSNAELQQFAYVASHDLQEPLRMVASFTQLLGKRYKDRLDGDAQEFIGYAVDGATRMQSLINDLLSYSRVGTQGKPFEAIGCDSIVDGVLGNLKLAIEETGAQIVRDALPQVTADAQQMGQLFQNLIANAIKFHGQEPPRVHISAARDGEEWKFRVRDNGIGFSAEYVDRIFIIFQRLHTNTDYPGTGIGLSLCKKIVERHHGRIWAESSPGQGSTFYFTLPAAESERVEEHTASELQFSASSN